jgi:TolB-like protein/DNA-binding winged helix-turn-helix (wHTH) protein/cytochrome c-type biogenesis protein CcmH/NrfG
MSSAKLRFRDYQLDPDGFELRRAGHRLRLERKPMELLILLAENQGHLVKREEIIERIWGKDFFFDAENGINNAIRKIRSALNDNAEQPLFVETSLGKGYRFIAPVERIPELTGSPAPERSVIPREPTVFRWRRAWVPALVLAAFVAAAFAFNLAGIRSRVLARNVPSIHSIVVLPLENLSGNPDEQYFADGMTDELTTVLAKIGSLRVISRTSSMQYRNSHKPLAQIANELNVDAVVEGSVTRSSDRVRITAQLVDARNDRHLWAETYDRDTRDILALQSDVASAIAKQVKAQITPAETAKLSTVRQADPEAYQFYLQGLYYWDKGTEQAAANSREYFQKAIEKDPGFARAWVGLAFAYNLLGDYAHGKEAARKALSLDDTIGRGHAAFAFATWRGDWDWGVAQSEFKRAIELDPNDAHAHHAYAGYLSALRRFEEAHSEMQRAVEIDPLAALANTNLGSIYWSSHDFDRAIQQLNRALEIDPNFPDAHFVLGLVYESSGKYEHALVEFEKCETLSRNGNLLAARAAVAHLYAVQGRRADALRLLEEVKAAHKPGELLSYSIALVYVGLGDKDRAFQWLQNSFAEHDDDLLDLNDDPRVEPLHSDSRFQALVRRVGIPVNGAGVVAH